MPPTGSQGSSCSRPGRLTLPSSGGPGTGTAPAHLAGAAGIGGSVADLGDPEHQHPPLHVVVDGVGILQQVLEVVGVVGVQGEDLLLLGWPVALGIAVLRYRLYDIDRLINRTLVYGLLTAVLGGVYAGVVLVLGQLLGQELSSLAVAGATLAAAALFQPARRRIQQAVDRRFNRRKYDAARTVEAFSARLRDEVDLDTLSAELLAVVDQTMEPTRASLWLRPSDKRPLRAGT
jgi:hypothetical protein